MHRLTRLSLTACAALTLLAPPVLAQKGGSGGGTSTYRDSAGRAGGTAERSGGGTTFRDGSGRITGTR